MNKVGYLTESGKYFTQEEAIGEAKRCLLCENNHCSKNCPIGVIENVKHKTRKTEMILPTLRLIIYPPPYINPYISPYSDHYSSIIQGVDFLNKCAISNIDEIWSVRMSA